MRFDQRFDSGMAYGGDGYCLSDFSTPIRALVPFTITPDNASLEPYLWYEISTRTGTEGRTTQVNTTSVSTGTAWARAITVGWQEKDLSLFPSAYAVSLAKQINIPFTPTPGSVSNLPNETGASTSSGLSTGAKAGVGVGAAVGFTFLLSIAILCLCLRRRRKHQVAAKPLGNDLPEMVIDTNGTSKTHGSN
jgi:hypothetical protein